MRSNIITLVLLLRALPAVGVCTSAKADFVIKNEPPRSIATTAPTAAPPVSMAPIVDPGDPGYSPTTTTPPVHETTTATHWKMAYGFGDNVPLGFACRQIVPPAVKVTYGAGADPRMLVSWKGGDTWNHVLRDAVKPLGLRLVMTHMAVEITK